MGGSHSVPESLIAEKYFSIKMKCVISMLGQATGEFEIHKPDHVLLKSKVGSNTFFIVHDNVKKQKAFFWTNAKGELSVNEHEAPYEDSQSISAAALWVQDIYQILETFEKKVAVPIKDEEKQFGDVKFSVKKDDISYSFYEKNSSLSAIVQERPASFGLLAYLVAFVESGQKLSEEQFTKIPEGLNWVADDS